LSVFIIAEPGVDHDGSLDKAKRLIDAAKAAGADACKFQFFNSRKLWGDDRIGHLELRFEQIAQLHRYCETAGIEFMCTPFGVEEVVLLRPLLQRIKIASGCLGRRPILAAAMQTGLTLIVSTGMAGMEEVTRAVEFLRGARLTLLHCTSSYPCAVEDANLRAMQTLTEVFALPVGYSDHTQGITVSIAAAAMGAQALEKHLTLDRTAPGPDHAASIDPAEFRVLVSAVRTVEAALGTGEKRLLRAEQSLRAKWDVAFPAHSAPGR